MEQASNFLAEFATKYEYNLDGIIHQKEAEEFVYDDKYLATYDRPEYRSKAFILNVLRFNNIIKNMKKVPESILDFGYGSGMLLNITKQAGVKSFGYDIAKAEVPFWVNKIDNIFEKKFTVVCFYDSLEHCPSMEFIKDLNTDYISISVPYCGLGELYPDTGTFMHWHHRKPNEHLWHFNRKSLRNFFWRHGFKQIDVSYHEDMIRKPTTQRPNILSAFFQKI